MNFFKVIYTLLYEDKILFTSGFALYNFLLNLCITEATILETVGGLVVTPGPGDATVQLHDPLRLQLGHMNNLYVAAATLASALLIFATVVMHFYFCFAGC